MVHHHSPDGSVPGFMAAVHQNANGSEARAYRLWMTEVLQPLNEKAAGIITEHIDLLESWQVGTLYSYTLAEVVAGR